MLHLYDTRAREVVPIQTARPGQLSLYACGPTVYRDAHVGNMRTFLLTDLIRRTAQARGMTVKIVQNITDVGHMADDTGLGGVDEGQGDTDDRVLQQAEREGKGALAVARFYEDRFHNDLARLNIIPADVYPRASECIDLMIDLIRNLMDNGHAYVGGDGSVFFDARSFASYGEISGNRLDELKPGHRFDGGVDPAKRFHADWALWKKAKETRTQLIWDTPWGTGFPGWHTECSAMSLHHLGDTIDIHTGGIDLRFPHHEDERAQSNSAAGKDVVTYWVHAEHLLFEGRKMSKSAGNVVLVQDVIDRGFAPEALRLAFLEHHYRQQMNLTWNAIEAADKTLNRWRTKMQEWSGGSSLDGHNVDGYNAQVIHEILLQHFEDDLDTSGAILKLREVEKDPSISEATKLEIFSRADELLGLNVLAAPKVKEVPAEVHELLERRAVARAEKNWAESDRLRDEIASHGFTVMDTSTGQQLA